MSGGRIVIPPKSDADVTKLHVGVLGPVMAWRNWRELPLGPPKQKALFTVLVMKAGMAVEREELVEAVWGSDAPRTADSSVHKYVAALRQTLEPGRRPRGDGSLLVSGAPSTYRLCLADGVLDASLFARRVEHAQQLRADGRFDQALRALAEAQRLWRGNAVGGAPGPVPQIWRASLEEHRVAAAELRIEILLMMGRNEDAVAELRILVGENPLREHLSELLMAALYGCARQAEALDVFLRVRRTLREELGVEPGSRLHRCYQQILRGELAPPDVVCAAHAGHVENVQSASRSTADT